MNMILDVRLRCEVIVKLRDSMVFAKCKKIKKLEFYEVNLNSNGLIN